RKLSWRFFVFGEVRFFAILLQARGSHLRTRALWRVHGLIPLGGRQLVGAPGLRDVHAAGEPWRRARTQLIHVEARACSHAASALAAVAQKNRDGIVRMTGLDPRRSRHFLAVEFERN